QKSLGRSARLQEVRGLYRCAGQVCGKQVLVVDDVMTTGATLSAIADALLEQGAERVWGAVAARTPLESGAPLRAVWGRRDNRWFYIARLCSTLFSSPRNFPQTLATLFGWLRTRVRICIWCVPWASSWTTPS